jgi:hypothetical protein
MSANFLRQDSNGTSQALRSKLQGLGAGTYDPEFMKQYRNVSNVMANPNQAPFIPAPNPAENRSQLVKKRMLIFSGDRDDRVGSSSTNFQITLNSALDEVVKVELRSFQSRGGINNVDGYNNAFEFRWNWTRSNSDYYVANPPPVGANPPTSFTRNFNQVGIQTIPFGSYTDLQFIQAVARAMNDNITYHIGRFADGSPWITGGIGETGKMELYTLDKFYLCVSIFQGIFYGIYVCTPTP